MQSFAFLANLIALMLLATTLTFAAEHQVNSADVLTNAATATDSATNHAKSTTAPSLIIGNRAPLQTPAYLRLPAGAVAPHGWLRRQLPVELAVGDEIRFVVDPNGSNGGDYTLWDGMNRGDRLQTDRGHGLHIDWGLCPGKMSYQWNRNNDLLIWRKAVGLR